MMWGMEVGWGTGISIAAGTAFIDAAYLYWGLLRLPRGCLRLLAAVPAVVSYAILPLIFDRQSHMLGVGIYFCFFTWVSTVKLILLCWDKGPASEPWVLERYLRFTVVMHLPIHVTRRERVVKQKLRKASWLKKLTEAETGVYLAARCVIKLLVMAGLVQIYAHRSSIPLAALELAYAVNLYLFVTVVLEGLAALSAAVCQVELEPHFDNPFAASSLEDFWARRWNLLISGLLKESVYEPALLLLTKGRPHATPGSQAADTSSAPAAAAAVDGPDPKPSASLRQRKAQRSSQGTGNQSVGKAGPSRGARFCAMFLTFLVSGIMHELAVFYMTSYLSGEMTAFFTLHGVATGLQVACKPYMREAGIKLPRWLSVLLTLSFTFTTAMWLFFAPMVASKADIRLTSEIVALLAV